MDVFRLKPISNCYPRHPSLFAVKIIIRFHHETQQIVVATDSPGSRRMASVAWPRVALAAGSAAHSSLVDQKAAVPGPSGRVGLCVTTLGHLRASWETLKVWN